MSRIFVGQFLIAVLCGQVLNDLWTRVLVSACLGLLWALLIDAIAAPWRRP